MDYAGLQVNYQRLFKLPQMTWIAMGLLQITRVYCKLRVDYKRITYDYKRIAWDYKWIV